MNISAINAPATPPYDYHNHSLMLDTHQHPPINHNHYIPYKYDDLHHTVIHEAVPAPHSASSAFHRVPLVSIPSPPEIMQYSEDEEELDQFKAKNVSDAPVTPSTHMCHSSSRRKSIPHRSPSYPNLDTKSIIFQLELDHSNDKSNMSPKVILGKAKSSLLWSVRKRVSLARNKNRLLASLSKRSVRALRIQIPRPHISSKDTYYDDPVSPTTSASSYAEITDELPSPMMYKNTAHSNDTRRTIIHQSQIKNIKTNKSTFSSHETKECNDMNQPVHTVSNDKKKSVGRRSHSTHASSGRPSRVKGPCQACNETSDGCMRKAFNWPFPTSTVFNDKGKPFVYLCNKCGLRYNKSGGCVCRHCRWVLCKEEKRKAMQLIDQMRLSRPGGKIDPNENIDNFLCTPKYWSCACPWKVGWVLHSQHDEDDEDITMEHSQSPSLSDATL